MIKIRTPFLQISKTQPPSPSLVWLVESSVIIDLCVITSMHNAVIINYQLFLY